MSLHGDGAWYAALFQREGHDVYYTLYDERYAGYLAGIAPEPIIVSKNEAYYPELYDLIVFDLSGAGKAADHARTVSPTIGGSSLADTLEHDRVAGLEYMQKCGISVPPYEVFTDPAEGIRYLKKTKKRTVFKPCGENDCSVTYVSKSHEDMIRFMDVLFRKTQVKEYVLQQYVKGAEISTEMWVNESGYYLPNHTLETKKLMAGDIGPATGCAGNVCWIPMGETAAFRRGLKLAADRLIQDGYVGPIDLNCIATEDEIYGIEWTPRFGYEGTCNLTRLLPIPFGQFLYRVALGERADNLIPANSFAASIRISVPPYPLEDAPRRLYGEGIPIQGIELERDLPNFFLQDVRRVPDSDELETAGVSGFVGAPIGVGETMFAAFDSVKQKIRSLQIPDMMWRNDVDEVCLNRYKVLELGGWLRTA